MSLAPTSCTTLAVRLGWCGLALAWAAGPVPAFAPADPSDEAVLADTGDGDDDDLWRRYGFSGLVVSKFNDGLFALQRADVDGDGAHDLVVVNNAKAKIEFLLQGRDPSEDDESFELVNELPDEERFRRDSVAVEQRVWALVMGDLDGDRRADAVFTGDSGRLTVAFAGEESDFLDTVEFPLAGGIANRDTLRLGDLDQDGRLDVAVLTTKGVQLFVQDELGALHEGELLPNASTGANAMHLADLDGDGRLDLVFVFDESEWPVRFRLGEPELRFGPEVRSRHAPIRGHLISDLDEDGAAEVVVMGRRSGRATVLRLQRDPQGTRQDVRLSAPNIVPFPDVKDAAKRAVDLSDLDGDGRLDLVVAEPGAARLVVYRGSPGGQFAGARVWPSLLGTSHPRVFDRHGDGLPDILLASPDESSIAVAAVDREGHVAFPTILGAPGGDLLVLDVDHATGAVWAVVAEGRGRTREYRLLRILDGHEDLRVPIEKVPADPSGMLLADLDRNGRIDVALFVPTEPPTILLGTDDPAVFTAVDPATPGLGVLKDVARSRTFYGDVDGDGLRELLVPAGNFARAITFGADGQPSVVVQANLGDAQAAAGSVAAADIDGDGRREIVVTDRTTGALFVLAIDGGTASQVARVDLAGLAVDGLLVADLDENGSEDIILWSKDAAATLVAGAPELRLVPVADYESPVKDAWLDAMAAGDVNGDGGMDIVFTETSKQLVHIAAFRAESLDHALKFQVFEARLFESSGRTSREPREVMVGDVTGDGLADVALLVHDRILVYPQEEGP